MTMCRPRPHGSIENVVSPGSAAAPKLVGELDALGRLGATHYPPRAKT